MTVGESPISRAYRRLRSRAAAGVAALCIATLPGAAGAGAIPVVGGNAPEIPAFLPMLTAVPAGEAMPIDGTWSITSIAKTVRIERGRVYAVEGWLHLFVLKIQPGMVVIKDLRPSAPGVYTAQDLPLMGPWQGRMTPDRTLAVEVQGALGPARYQMVPLQLDHPQWFAQAMQEAGLAGPGSAAPAEPPTAYQPPAYRPPDEVPAGEPEAAEGCVFEGTDPETGQPVCFD